MPRMPLPQAMANLADGTDFAKRIEPRSNLGGLLLRIIRPSLGLKPTLCQRFADDVMFAGAGEAPVEAVVEVSQPAMVETHEVQDRGVQVADVRPAINAFEAQLVGRTDRLAPL